MGDTAHALFWTRLSICTRAHCLSSALGLLQHLQGMATCRTWRVLQCRQPQAIMVRQASCSILSCRLCTEHRCSLQDATFMTAGMRLIASGASQMMTYPEGIA